MFCMQYKHVFFQQLPTSNVSFLGSAKDGDTFLNSSVYIPSAPPLLQPNGSIGVNYSVYKDVLEAEPPDWLPDSSTTVCMQCTVPFTALARGRHHCLFCGGVFCKVCTKGGVCYLLSSGRGIPRGSVMPAMISLIHYRVFLLTPSAMLCK